jgi:cbb3-type cytochrome oxidase subunit 3
MCAEFYVILISILVAVVLCGLLLAVIFWELRKKNKSPEESG